MRKESNFAKDIIIDRVYTLYNLIKSEFDFYKIEFIKPLESVSGISLYPLLMHENLIETIKFWKEVPVYDLIKIEKALLEGEFIYYKSVGLDIMDGRVDLSKCKYLSIYEYEKVIKKMYTNRIYSQVIYDKKLKKITINLDNISYYLIVHELVEEVVGDIPLSNLSKTDLHNLGDDFLIEDVCKFNKDKTKVIKF